jgi:hypothetical protein
MMARHAVKKGTRYRYYVSRSLITKDRTEDSAGLRIPAAEIEQLVSSRVHRWLLDPAVAPVAGLDRPLRQVLDPAAQHGTGERPREMPRGEQRCADARSWVRPPRVSLIEVVRVSAYLPRNARALMRARQPGTATRLS